MKEFYFYMNFPEVIEAETLDEAYAKLQEELYGWEDVVTDCDSWSVDYDLEDEDA